MDETDSRKSLHPGSIVSVGTNITPRTVTVLGSTGSIGRSTIDLIARTPGRFRVEALAVNANVDLLAGQALALRPAFVAVADRRAYRPLRDRLQGSGIEIGAGPEAVIEAARRPAEWVGASIVGAAGLQPTLAAIRRGAVVALANKETLVCAGELIMAEVARSGATLLPVDSEHSAIFQVFDFSQPSRVEKIILTASGGPFRRRNREAMVSITPAEAVAHPNWDMGAKISVDSATMMNKGLEIIEAHHLFRLPETQIEVLIHPQSVIHSMVAYVDGSVLAQLGSPDMRTPLAFALGWPARIPAPAPRLDLAAVATLTFEVPDPKRFPALQLARQVLRTGGAAPTIFNAANEVAVQKFLAGKIGFLDITDIVAYTLDELAPASPGSLDEVIAVDGQARQVARDFSRAASAIS
ncbi:1-deoxy-D-xylulose 5-phosphate reductoisomerase [invertebrate metagenome]|uniref:1-deoxy-D-xylulose-5-phosphate reductoisomerase n=1 Tax=invertebrate metagenome TaxID=1711999 RepID=A0A484HCA3_9ZZZZ